jgi:hypothetical protein
MRATTLAITALSIMDLIGLHPPPDGVTNLKYKLKCFLTTKFFVAKRRRH